MLGLYRHYMKDAHFDAQIQQDGNTLTTFRVQKITGAGATGYSMCVVHCSKDDVVSSKITAKLDAGRTAKLASGFSRFAGVLLHEDPLPATSVSSYITFSLKYS